MTRRSHHTPRRALVSVLFTLAGLLALGSTPAWGSALPDNRIYEMVTPAENDNADVYIPNASKLGPGLPEAGETVTERPFQAAADGESVAYVADPSFEGNGLGGELKGNEYLSTHTAGGWRTQTITPLGYNSAAYVAFSPDLSVGILAEGEETPLAPGGLAEYKDLYTRTNSEGRYQALFTRPPSHRSVVEFGWLEKEEYSACCNGTAEHALYAGASSDFSHVLFEADDALTPPAESEYATTGNNLYDSIDGQPTSVNLLPNGKPAPVATFGGYLPQPDEPGGCSGNRIKRPSFSHVISADGTRVFWTDLSTEKTAENPAGVTRLFVRENGGAPEAMTVQVDASVGGGGEYWTASADGSLAFFTRAGDLYEFDVNTGQTTDLARGGEVQGVIGASEDGESVYFVADGELAAGATAGQPNLYLSHGGTTSFLATLSAADNGVPDDCDYIGDWWPNLGDRTAEVTPSGQDIVFESVNSLTGYDSRGSSEVYVYDARSGRISCASCNPSGEPPSGVSYLPTGGSHAPTHQPRWLSDDGGRVFFDTTEALAPHDTNGTMDAYEWERDGAGSCQSSTGCVYLLSGGTSPGPSYFIDASASGDDAFFVTRAQLARQDDNYNINLYDVHVGGASAPSEAQCTGTGCQGVPFPPPAFEAPASVTFEGVGNYPPSQPRAGQPTLRTVKCKRGHAKKRGKCAKQKAKKARKARGRRRHRS